MDIAGGGRVEEPIEVGGRPALGPDFQHKGEGSLGVVDGVRVGWSAGGHWR